MSLLASKSFVPIFILLNAIPQSLLLLFTDFTISASLWFEQILLFCDLHLIWSCFLMSSTVFFVLNFSNRILHVFYNQYLQFPLDATLLENQGKTLGDCMVHPNNILKHLAFLDFCTISKLEGDRRRKIFELSIPGNQPHLWNRTSLQCLQEFELQRLEIQNECERKESSKLRLHQQQQPPPKDLSARSLFSPVKATDTASAKSDNLKSPQRSNESSQEQKPIAKKRLFENLQIVIWAIEGLCNLVSCSLVEDSYGVVQKSIPSVISELLLLLEACEKFSKLSVTQQPITADAKAMEISQHEMIDASSLKIAVKSGIYTITSTFKQHTAAFRLNGEHKKRLMAFLEYDE